MGKKSKLVITTVVLMLMFVAGCSVSKEEMIEETKNTFIEGFHQERVEANEETAEIHYFLPSSFSVSDVSENNVIFEKGNQPFLLFYNPAEGLDSQVNMERDLEFKEEALLFETIDSEGRFGYIMVVPEESDQYTLVIGVGGMKITTMSSLSDLSASAKDMIEVLNSISYK
ncbi:hypothetical protein ACJ2A9_13425 [Anaerobacillus sp. MEB173]|uniref:hypothetical protein n=1 Tax=Anaerobacillus sp. MEB173 TaxID=3383345 RepID=UPI003F8DC9DC